jgi:hypothetical protein
MGMLGIPILSDVWGAVSGVFAKVAGVALDGVISLITPWIAAGLLLLIEATWNFMDTAARPRPEARWFSGTPSPDDGLAPVEVALTIGASVLVLTLVLAVLRAVIAGSPGAVTRTICHDLPLAVFAMATTIAFTQAALDVTDEMSDWIWDMTRDETRQALENLSKVVMIALKTTHFVGVALCVGMIAGLLVLWAMLFIRSSLIYIVIVFALSFGWPALMFPAMRDTAKKALELLIALIIVKPVISLALSVGISALAAFGDAGDPGKGVGSNAARELGVMLAGVVCFGLAACMPYMVLKLMPVVAAAVVAQGIASAPVRAAQQATQMQYYGAAAMKRLSSGGTRVAKSTAEAGGGKASGDQNRSQVTDRLAGATR